MFRSATTAVIQAPLRAATSSRLTSSAARRSLITSKPSSSPFSTQLRRLQQQQTPPSKQKSGQSSQLPPNGEPETPTFSLDGLGISPNMKKVIIGVICVFGTMETYTYYIWIKNRWFPDEKQDGEATQA